MALTHRKCVRVNTNNFYRATAGHKSLYLVLWTVTKEEPKMVILSLMGEQRQARVKNDTQLIETKKW